MKAGLEACFQRTSYAQAFVKARPWVSKALQEHGTVNTDLSTFDGSPKERVRLVLLSGICVKKILDSSERQTPVLKSHLIQTKAKS